ncbi:hypothetical protein CMI38_01020 [Candidatus Pacearchaeota archaeon]|jgi:hypothetical protein|nr:hypothetical protein [Candidatus Pacearchaeota archaeon]
MSKSIYGNTSIYIPKYDRNFIKICEQYVANRFPDSSWSQFVIMCIKHYINGLPKKEKESFESHAWKLAKLEKPKSTEFVDKFIKTMH